jgi:RNA polymerase sigma-70 factor, ECF subfamily
MQSKPGGAVRRSKAEPRVDPKKRRKAEYCTSMAPSLAWTLPGTLRQEWGVSVVRHGAEVAVDGQLADLDEPALVEACLAGQSGAFDLIVERHRRAIYQLCYRFVSNHEDASDLSQDVFVRAFKGLKSFRRQSSLGTWLYRICVNVCLNRVNTKTLATEELEEQQHVDTGSDSPADRLLKDERAARVRAAIAQLPRKQRATLVLRMYHEMSHQEIAEVLGSSVGAVKANFFHALANLKRQLGDQVW